MRRVLTILRSDNRLFALFLLVFLLRLAIPAGFMIAPAGAAIGLIPCPQVAAVPHAGMGHQGRRPSGAHPATHKEAPCPYAALAAPALPPGSPPVALPPAPSGQVDGTARLAAVAAVPLAAPPPPSRAPPVRT